ncbi:MAG: hydroxyphenylacetyl-CoA thioesterase PaaI [Pseudomonadota bacterium]
MDQHVDQKQEEGGTVAFGDRIARACADRMFANDEASRSLGMEIADVTAGRAVLTMTVRDNMTNGQKICHGGFMFTLADSAFAFACNGYNQFTVAQHCAIDFLKTVFAGDTLTAVAEEQTKTGRSGVYDVVITDQNENTVALFRGLSRTVKGNHFKDEELAELRAQVGGGTVA